MQTEVDMKLETPQRRGGVVLGADGRQIGAAPGYGHSGRKPITSPGRTGCPGLWASSAVGARQITEYTHGMQEPSRR